MGAFIRLVERISGSAGFLAAWLVAPLVVATCYEVFSRYVLNDPTLWAYEIGYMATGTNFLLGAAFTLREGGHIRIDVLYSRFGEKTKALVEAFGFAFLLLPVSWWLTWRLWNYAYEAYLIGETTGESAWDPIVWPFRMTFFLGFALLSLQGVVGLIKACYVLLDKELPIVER